MITNENKKLAQWAMEYALKNGCQSSRVTLYNGSSSSFEIRDMKIDRLQQASENSMVVHLFVDGRYGSYSTNRLDKKELEKFIKDGIAATRFLAEDKARTLPDASLYYKGGAADLRLVDPNFDSVQPDDKVALAMSVCEEIMGKDDRIISANASYSDEKDFKYMVASNGFEGEASGSSYGLVGSVSIRGEGALERVLRKLGQRKVASGKYTMIVDNMNSSRLLSPVIGAIYGSSIQQKNSFLLDKIDQKVASDKMTLIDEPHLVKASGARYFDSEGVATKRLPVFEQGILKTYYIDTYSANKMGMEQTIGSPSILTMRNGDKDLDGLIASIDKGILVTGFDGGNCNSTTGDFSYGVEGFLIERGKLSQPISEMNATGNMLSLWSNLAEIPSLLFNGVDFSGL